MTYNLIGGKNPGKDSDVLLETVHGLLIGLPSWSLVSILYTLAVSPSLGGSRQHKRNNIKQWGFHSVLLAMTRDPAEFGWHCWSNTAHPPPSSTTTSLHRCHLPYCPYHRVASIRQPLCAKNKLWGRSLQKS